MGASAKARAADAHDAGPYSGASAKARAADAHDAAPYLGASAKARAADAHDAGPFGGLEQTPVQLILLMLGRIGGFGQSLCS